MWSQFIQAAQAAEQEEGLFATLLAKGFEAIRAPHCQTLTQALHVLENGELAQLEGKKEVALELQAARATNSPDLCRIKAAIARRRQLERQLKFARYVNAPDFWIKRKDALLQLPR